jgi:DNA-binding NtrC family response regulator
MRASRAAALYRFEAEYLRSLIERAGGNASEAARLARMDRPYLLTLLRKHALRG